MTFGEYAQIVGNNLVQAHDRKDRDALIAVFNDADQTLEHSNISLTDRKEFWELVRKDVNARSILIEKQANSELLALMQMIQVQLEARTGKKK